jgi:ferritin-like metal-binding protein YciE
MTVDSTEDLFLDGLQELYYTEQRLADTLEMHAAEVQDADLSQALSEHQDETQQHVERLEQVFEQLDEDATARTDPVLSAMIDEHEAFAAANDGDVLDRYDVAHAQKVEHYEIAAYGSLTSLASELGYDEASDTLAETLHEEEDALEALSTVGEQFDETQVASD